MDKISPPVLIKKLYLPAPQTHKGDNGRLLIMAGSPKYHGSLILAATMASKIVDLVYVATTPENFEILQKIKKRLAEFIYISPRDLMATAAESDALLIGPGLLSNVATKRLVKKILQQYLQKKIVLDAGALRVLDPRWLHDQCIVTPHAGEFRAIFHCSATAESARRMSKKYRGIIVLKGATDYIATSGQLYYNTTGNAGMTKGGTGDVLAGLIAALAAKNDPLLSAEAGVYVNGLAGDRLYKKYGYYYSANELIPEAQKVLGVMKKLRKKD